MKFIKIDITEDLLERAKSRWDDLMALPEMSSLGPPFSGSMVVRLLLTQLLDELDGLDEDAGGPRKRRKLITEQGTLFAVPEVEEGDDDEVEGETT